MAALDSGPSGRAATQYYLVCKYTGGIVDAVLTELSPSELLETMPHGETLLARTEDEISDRVLEQYEYWSRRP
jgi:hypothetical protein